MKTKNVPFGLKRKINPIFFKSGGLGGGEVGHLGKFPNNTVFSYATVVLHSCNVPSFIVPFFRSFQKWLTKTNNSKSVSTNPCATKGGIFQLFWTCDLLPLLHLCIKKVAGRDLLDNSVKSARLVFVVTTDHVSQPVGPSVKVEDETQCCVGHL